MLALALAGLISVELDDRLQTLGLAEWAAGRAPKGFAAPPLPKPELTAPPAPAESFDFLTRTDAVMRFSPDLFVPDMFYQRAGGKPALESWRAGLSAFAKKPEAARWLAERRRALAGVVARYREDVDQADYQRRIEAYVGLPLRGSYALRLSEFHARGSQINIVANSDDGRHVIVSMLGPARWEGGRPVFDPADLPPTAWHELAHGLTDELVDLHSELLRERAGHYAKLGWDCYGAWSQCVKEHVVRAVMLRLLERHVGADAAERELAKEEKRFPWLRAMTRALERYESSGKPNLGHFMADLIEVVPPAPAAAEAPPPGRSWLHDASYPFASPARRAAALDLLAKLPPRPDLLRRRAALLAGDGRCVEAVPLLSADGSAAASFIKGSCLQSAAELRRAKELCEEPGLCASAAEALRRLPSAEGRWSAYVDPRLELLGVVYRLARPDGAADPRFARFAGHRAVRELEALLEKRGPGVAAGAVLQASAPPELAVPSGPEASWIPDRFMRALRDFAKEAEFDAYFRESAPRHRELTVRAEKEANGGMTAEEVAGYLRLPTPEMRFALSTLLPPSHCVNAGIVRARCAGPKGFGLGDFGADVGHEAAHALLDPLADERLEEIEAYSGLMREGCTDTWRGCVLEHVDLAVTLRALARRDSKRAAELEAEYSARFPYLKALTKRLAEFEAAPAPAFQDFYPRLIDVFGDLLGEDARRRARRNLAARRAGAPRATGVDASPRVDARVELAAALLLLADGKAAGPYAHVQEEALARLAPLKSHPAARRAARHPRAVPRLLLSLGAPPELARAAPLPPEDARELGGEEAVAAAVDELRDFAAKAKLWELAPDVYASLRALPARPPVTAVSPLVPAGKPLRIGDWVVSAPYEAEPELSFEVDRNVELVSILALLARGKPWPGSDEAYARRVLDWFGGLSSHPAVALGREAAGGDGRLDALAGVALRLDAGYKLREAPPEGYFGGLGERSSDEVAGLLGGFARAGRLDGFMKAAAGDHARWLAAARAEALRALSPSAAAAYLGRPFGARYVFLLSGTLPSTFSANLALLKEGRLHEYRLRGGSGERFGFDHFGNSVAHELIHLVTNPLAAALEVKGRPPAGCNDAQTSTWADCAQEHLVYAVSMRALARDLGETAYKDLLDTYAPRGFPFLAGLGEALKEYERSRARYGSLEDFWPRLAAVFHGRAPAPRPDKGRRLKDQGVEAFLKGDGAGAERLFRAALAAAPDDAEALLNLGVVVHGAKREDEASSLYERAAKAGLAAGGRGRELAAAALSSRAGLMRARGRRAEERRDLRRALEAAPGDWGGAADARRRLEELR